MEYMLLRRYVAMLAFLSTSITLTAVDNADGATSCRVYRQDGSILCEATCDTGTPVCHGNALGGGTCSCATGTVKTTISFAGTGLNGLINVEIYDIGCKTQPCDPALQAAVSVPVTEGETPLQLSQEVVDQLELVLPAGCNAEAVEGDSGPAFRVTCDAFLTKFRLCDDHGGTCPDERANDPDYGVDLAGYRFQTDEAQTSAVGDPPTAQVSELSITSLLPNPFTPGVQVAYSAEAGSHVTLTVHNAGGQIVRTLLDATDSETGSGVVSWDARDDDKVPVPNGVYFFVVAAGGETRTVKGALLR